jgi:hypothetical protein
VAKNAEDAMIMISDYLNVTNEEVEFEKVLWEYEVSRMGLKPGEVREL